MSVSRYAHIRSIFIRSIVSSRGPAGCVLVLSSTTCSPFACSTQSTSPPRTMRASPSLVLTTWHHCTLRSTSPPHPGGPPREYASGVSDVQYDSKLRPGQRRVRTIVLCTKCTRAAWGHRRRPQRRCLFENKCVPELSAVTHHHGIQLKALAKLRRAVCLQRPRSAQLGHDSSPSHDIHAENFRIDSLCRYDWCAIHCWAIRSTFCTLHEGIQDRVEWIGDVRLVVKVLKAIVQIGRMVACAVSCCGWVMVPALRTVIEQQRLVLVVRKCCQQRGLLDRYRCQCGQRSFKWRNE